MKILITVVTGFVLRGYLYESRSDTELIDIELDLHSVPDLTILTQKINDHVLGVRRRYRAGSIDPSVLSVCHSILP